MGNRVEKVGFLTPQVGEVMLERKPGNGQTSPRPSGSVISMASLTQHKKRVRHGPKARKAKQLFSNLSVEDTNLERTERSLSLPFCL